MFMISLKELQQHTFVGAEKSLAQIGVNPGEKISTYENFSEQVDSHALHVIEDRPVSNAYTYFIDKGEIYIDEERRTKLFIDPEERGGLSLLGTKEAIKKSLLHPGQIVFLYSPPGQVVFEKGTKYDKVKPYPDGQIYLLASKNDCQIDAMAISVSKEQERQVLSTFFGKKNIDYGGFDDETTKIKYFLTHSTIRNFNIDGLLSYLEDISHEDDFLVYKNVHKEEFFLSDILHDLKQGWMKEIKPRINIDYQKVFDMAQRGDIRGAYINQLKDPIYIDLYAKNGKIPLGGGCGGNDSENENNPLKEFMNNDPLSTNYRLKTPSIEDVMKKNNEDSDEKGSLEFDCPNCNETHKREPHTLMENCPVTGKPIPKC